VKEPGSPPHDIAISTNNAREIVAIAHRAVARSPIVPPTNSSPAERLTKNQSRLNLETTVAIAAKRVKVAIGTILLRRTITDLMLRTETSWVSELPQPIFLIVRISSLGVTEPLRPRQVNSSIGGNSQTLIVAQLAATRTCQMRY